MNVKRELKSWDEVKTFLKVARLNTVSAAAKELGVHRATVIRHVDSIEEQLATKLFIRHQKGYTPSEHGESSMQVDSKIELDFNTFYLQHLSNKNRISGDLIITSLKIFSYLLVPSISKFMHLDKLNATEGISGLLA